MSQNKHEFELSILDILVLIWFFTTPDVSGFEFLLLFGYIYFR
jgi:hypothetical protein